MAIIKDGDVDYDYKVGRCDRCGKDIVFSFFKPYETYRYRLDYVEKGKHYRKIYCGWNCYCAAKKEYCIKNINKGRSRAYTSTPCEEWLDSVTPHAHNDSRTVMERLGLEVKMDENNKKRISHFLRRKPKYELIKPYFEQIREMRNNNVSWKDIIKILNIDVSDRSICYNFHLMEKRGLVDEK